MVPDKPILNGQKLVEMPKIQISNETFSVIFKQYVPTLMALFHYSIACEIIYFNVIKMDTYIDNLYTCPDLSSYPDSYSYPNCSERPMNWHRYQPNLEVRQGSAERSSGSVSRTTAEPIY